MEFEIDDCDALFDASTNPSLVHRAARKPGLTLWSRQRAVVIPEEEEQPA